MVIIGFSLFKSRTSPIGISNHFKDFSSWLWLYRMCTNSGIAYIIWKSYIPTFLINISTRVFKPDWKPRYWWNRPVVCLIRSSCQPVTGLYLKESTPVGRVTSFLFQNPSHLTGSKIDINFGQILQDHDLIRWDPAKFQPISLTFHSNLASFSRI